MAIGTGGIKELKLNVLKTSPLADIVLLMRPSRSRFVPKLGLPKPQVTQWFFYLWSQPFALSEKFDRYFFWLTIQFRLLLDTRDSGKDVCWAYNPCDKERPHTYAKTVSSYSVKNKTIEREAWLIQLKVGYIT